MSNQEAWVEIFKAIRASNSVSIETCIKKTDLAYDAMKNKIKVDPKH